MKKLILAVLLAALSLGVPLFAQQTSIHKESEYYYYNFTIEKIYSHRLGFVILYRKNSSNQLTRTYIPHEWFTDIGSRGEIVGLRSGTEWPSMIVYYKDGEFSHVRLRIRRDRSHETWGVIPISVNIDEHFRDIEEVKIEH